MGSKTNTCTHGEVTMSVTNYWQEINPLKASIPFRACYVLRNLFQRSFNNNNIHVLIIEKLLFVLAYTLRQNLLDYCKYCHHICQ